MKLKVIIHEADEGGLCAEVPAIPGCMTQGETIKELIENLCDAVEGCLRLSTWPRYRLRRATWLWSLLSEMKTISGKRGLCGFASTNLDAFVKSLPGRHSREGGSPEALVKTGFPPPRE